MQNMITCGWVLTGEYFTEILAANPTKGWHDLCRCRNKKKMLKNQDKLWKSCISNSSCLVPITTKKPPPRLYFLMILIMKKRYFENQYWKRILLIYHLRVLSSSHLSWRPFRLWKMFTRICQWILGSLYGLFWKSIVPEILTGSFLRKSNFFQFGGS